MASSDSSLQTEDFISNVPDIASDKILELLPIKMAARMSVLSKHWRRKWLSLKHLVFYESFCEKRDTDYGICDWRKFSDIVSTILFHHNGPVHEFILFVLPSIDVDDVNLSNWLSFLSKNAVRRITIMNYFHMKVARISSYVFWCSELVHLDLIGCVLNSPPTDFTGFPKLLYLSMSKVEFAQQDIFSKLVAKCPMLSELRLIRWRGMDHIVLLAPRLDTLFITGSFESIAFRDVRNLRSVSANFSEFCRGRSMNIKSFDVVNLASSSRLQDIQFDGHLCKFLAAGGITKHFPTAFNQLNKLRLYDLELGDSCVFRFVFGMLKNCPYIKELDITVIPNKNANQHVLDCDNLQLHHLREAKIIGITGSSAELTLIKHVLATADVLEKLSLKCGKIDTETELTLLRMLVGFPRASTKARLVC